MFKNLTCIFISPNDFLSYNDAVAGLFSDFRMTANAGIHRQEDRMLSEEEIHELLEAVERLEEIEERVPTEEELRLIDDIQVFHPEVRYIVKSVALAARGRKRLKKKKEKKRLTREEEERKAEQRKVTDEEKQRRKEELEQNKRVQEKEAQEKKRTQDDLYKQLRSADRGEKEYEGWQGMLMNMFDFFSNPELSKTQRLALRRNKQRLLKDLRKNYRNFKKIEKQLNENRGLVEYLDKSVDEGVLDTGSLAAFTELIRRDPDLVKLIDLPTISKDAGYKERNEIIKKFLKNNKDPSIQVDLGNLKTVKDIEDFFEEPSEKVEDYLFDALQDEDVKVNDINIYVEDKLDQKGKRVVVIEGPLLEVSRAKINLKLPTKDLYNKSFWDRKKV